MSDRRKRLAILLLAACAVALYLAVLLFFVGARLGCEDAEQAAFDTVGCDSERGSGWRAVQSALLAATGLGVLVGAVVAFSRRRFLPLAVPAVAIVPVFVAVGVIDGIELGDKPVPRVTEVRLIDRSCRVPCRDGIRVAVTVDLSAEVELHLGPARFEDIGSRQYSSRIVGEPGATAEVDAGRHEFRVTGEILNPPGQRGPLPPGDYEVDVTARPQDAGNQRRQSGEPIARRVTIRP